MKVYLCFLIVVVKFGLLVSSFILKFLNFELIDFNLLIIVFNVLCLFRIIWFEIKFKDKLVCLNCLD